MYALVGEIPCMGSIEVKLAISRFIAEFLLRSPQTEQNYLDHSLNKLDGNRYVQEGGICDGGEELETFGSVILVEALQFYLGIRSIPICFRALVFVNCMSQEFLSILRVHFPLIL